MDTVEEQIPSYEKSGFYLTWCNLRYTSVFGQIDNKTIASNKVTFKDFNKISSANLIEFDPEPIGLLCNPLFIDFFQIAQMIHGITARKNVGNLVGVIGRYVADIGYSVSS